MAAIIYANAMFFDGECSIDNLLGAVAQWLNESSRTGGRFMGGPFDASILKKSGTIPFPYHKQVQIWSSSDTYPKAYSIRYSHPDDDKSGRPVFGRQWITEVGFRREFEDGNIECTVLLRTEDDSPNSNLPEVSRPNLVPSLIKECSLISDVDGLSLEAIS